MTTCFPQAVQPTQFNHDYKLTERHETLLLSNDSHKERKKEEKPEITRATIFGRLRNYESLQAIGLLSLGLMSIE